MHLDESIPEAEDHNIEQELSKASDKKNEIVAEVPQQVKPHFNINVDGPHEVNNSNLDSIEPRTIQHSDSSHLLGSKAEDRLIMKKRTSRQRIDKTNLNSEASSVKPKTLHKSKKWM